MARKDWTKVKTNPKSDLIHFVRDYNKINGSDGSASLFVSEQDYDEKAWGYKKPNDWTVTYNNYKGTEIDKSLKSKSQAMAYANNYMESH